MNLNLCNTTGFSVYCHIFEEASETADPYCVKTKGKIEKKLYHLLISKKQILSDDFLPKKKHFQLVEIIKIASFEKNKTKWTLSNNFYPTIAQLGNSPFFEEPLSKLEIVLKSFYNDLIEKSINRTKLRPSGVFECILYVHEMLRLIANRHEIKPHPYVLYETLYKLYMASSIYRYNLSGSNVILYHHEDPALWFEPLLTKLMENINHQKIRTIKLRFKLHDGAYVVEFSKKTNQVNRTYFTVKPKGEKVHQSVNNIPPKLGSKSHLPKLYGHALAGVVVKQVITVPFKHDLGSNVICFHIDNNDQQWERALKEGNLAFYAQENFSDFSFFLFLEGKF